MFILKDGVTEEAKIADDGWSWNGEKFKTVKVIALNNRVEKEKCFVAEGSASEEVEAEYIQFRFYVSGQQIEVEAANKILGRLNAYLAVDQAIENFKAKFGRWAFNQADFVKTLNKSNKGGTTDDYKIYFTLVKEKDSDMQMATLNDEGAPFSLIQYIFKCRQRVVLKVKNGGRKKLLDIEKYISDSGGSVEPENISFDPVKGVDSNAKIFYNRDYDRFDKFFKPPYYCAIVDKDMENAALEARGIGKAIKGFMGTNNEEEKNMDYIALIIDETKRENILEKLMPKAIEEAKKNAVKLAKDNGIAIEGITPLLEIEYNETIKKDFSGGLKITAKARIFY